MNRTVIFKVLSVIAALVLWQAVAMAVGMDMLLASPVNVLTRLFSIWREPGFVSTVLFSFLRITVGYLAALLSGIVFGFIAGRYRFFEMFLWPYVITVRTVPVASFIILCLIWLNYNQLAVLISFLIAFPVVYSNVLQGVKNTDPKMLQLVKVFHITPARQILYVYLPSLRSYIVSAGSVSVGMAWKAGVAAEVIGIVAGSIGEQLYLSKVYFQNADLLCWTIVIILLSVLTEKLFVFIINKIFDGVEKL